MKPKTKQIISSVIFALIILGIGWYIKENLQEFRNIHIVSWWSLVFLFLLAPVYFIISSLFFKKSLEPFSLNLPLMTCIGLTMVTLMGNYTIPFSGLGFRAVYMKKVYTFSYRNFITSVIVNWVTNFLIYTLAAIFSMIIYYYQTHSINWTLAVIFLLMMTFSILAFVPISINFKNKLIKRLYSPILIWQSYIKNRNILYKLLNLTFWQFIVSALMFYFAYLTFGFKVTYIESFLATTLSLYTSLIRLVPASLGFYELAIVYPSKVLGLSSAQGLSVSALTRIVTIFWTFSSGLIFSYFLAKPLTKGEKLNIKSLSKK